MKKKNEGILFIAAALAVLLTEILRLGHSTELAVVVLLAFGLIRLAGK